MRSVLTVIALYASVGGHGAVTCVVLPLLDTNTHVGTRVLLTGGAGTCRNPAIPRTKQTHSQTQTRTYTKKERERTYVIYNPNQHVLKLTLTLV